MLEVPYADASLSYYGVWRDTGVGMRTGWESATVRFKVSGTTSIVIRMGYSGAYPGYTVAVFDDGQAVSGLATTVDDGGDRVTTFSGLSTGEHTVLLKLTDQSPSRRDLVNGTTSIQLKSVSLDDGANIIEWPQSQPRPVAFWGDSWTALWSDWPRFIDAYEVNCFGVGGFRAADGDTYYDIVYGSEHFTSAERTRFPGYVIAYGVNDYNGGVSTSAFKASVQSLVNKIQTYNPNAHIWLVQAPRCSASSPVRYYDQYGTVLSEIAASEGGNVHYVSTSAIWGNVTWQSDFAHLDFSSRQYFAAWMEGKIAEQLGFPVSGQVNAVSSVSCNAVAVPMVSGQVDAVSSVSCRAFIPYDIQLDLWDGYDLELQILDGYDTGLQLLDGYDLELQILDGWDVELVFVVSAEKSPMFGLLSPKPPMLTVREV